MAVTTTTVIAAIAVAAAVGGGVYAYQGAQQQKRTSKAIGEYNQKQAEMDALQTEMENRENVRRKRRENVRLQAVQRARYAKAGVVEEGTPLEVMAETAGLLELDALEMNRQALGNAARLRAQGKFAKAAGDAGAAAAAMQGNASLLSSVGSAAGQTAQYRQTGVF
jgi:hypothetical protein